MQAMGLEQFCRHGAVVENVMPCCCNILDGFAVATVAGKSICTHIFAHTYARCAGLLPGSV